MQTKRNISCFLRQLLLLSPPARKRQVSPKAAWLVVIYGFPPVLVKHLVRKRRATVTPQVGSSGIAEWAADGFFRSSRTRAACLRVSLDVDGDGCSVFTRGAFEANQRANDRRLLSSREEGELQLSFGGRLSQKRWLVCSAPSSRG